MGLNLRRAVPGTVPGSEPREKRRFRRPSGLQIVFISLLILLANLVVVPVLLVVLTSFNIGPRGVSGLPTITNYVNAITSGATWSVLGNTILFAVGSTAISVSLGVAFAFLAERSDMPLRRYLFVLIPLTITIPGILYAISMVLLLSPRIGLFNIIAMGLFGAKDGLLTGWAGIGLTAPPFDSYSLLSMVVVEGLRGVAVVFLMTVGVFRNMDPSLEEAGQMSGAPNRTVTRRITLGIMLPGILAAALYSFTSSLETFEVPAIMGLPVNINTLSTLIFLQAQTGRIAAAATIGVGFLIIAVAAVILYGRQVRNIERFSTVTGKGFRPRVMRIGRLRWPALGVIGTYLLLVAIAPLFVIVWASVLPYYQPPSAAALKLLTLDSYEFILTHPYGLDAIRNTVLVTLIAPTIAVAVAAPVSWFVVRSRMRGKRILDILSFFPHAVPSTVIAIGLVYVFLTAPWRFIPIYGTIWIIALALGIRNLAFGSRTFHSAMLQLHKDLEEAGQVSGVPFRLIFLRVVLPILMPSIVAIWVFIAMVSVRDATMSIMLGSAQSRVLPLFMWDAWQNGRVSDAAATGVLLMLGCWAILVVGRLVERAQSKRISS
jgi:iron(III) transport system permease protein